MSETTKKSGKAYLIFSIVFIIAAIVTLIPYKNIDDACLFGYKAVCAFTPISTVILLVFAVIFFIIFNKKRKDWGNFLIT